MKCIQGDSWRGCSNVSNMRVRLCCVEEKTLKESEKPTNFIIICKRMKKMEKQILRFWSRLRDTDKIRLNM